MKSIGTLALLCAMFLVGCTTDHSLGPDALPVPVKTSVIVSVSDQNGLPVSDALVTVDQVSGFTDASGLFYIPEVTVDKRAYLTVYKEGYFNGSRRFYADGNTSSYVRIALIQQVDVGSFSAQTGGQMQVDLKSTLSFPPGSVSRADGSVYNGAVQVKAFTIHADDPNLSNLMPGRLEGKNDQGIDGVLLSYGMLAVELQSDQGEELNVAPGHLVEFRIQIPEAMIATAPVLIPLWYFDEQQGEWIHEGDALLQGDTYIGQVSHFSFWNCDDWTSSIEWEATFVEESAEPLTNLRVSLTVLSTGSVAYDYTNDQGRVHGRIPSGEQFRMQVINDCGEIIFSEQIGPYERNAKFGPVTLASGQGGLGMSTVSGNVLGCDELPVTNGYVLLQLDNSNYVRKVNPTDGKFEFRYANCDASNISLVAVDLNTAKQSQARLMAYGQALDAGAIKACDDLEEYVIIHFDGYPKNYFFIPRLAYSAVDSATVITESQPLLDGFAFELKFKCTTPGPCEVDEESGVSINLPTPEGEVYMISMNMILEEYGPAGGKIKGSFSGVVNGGDNGQGGPEYTNFTGSFSVNR